MLYSFFVIPLFKSLLMVENYRHGVGTDLVELPGGFINEDEVPLGAARRELIEETGYTCDKVKVVK
jgi:8-oxo-dGTP pyrophosphatase MutT (NUDIX family)